jgi:hypothetical protein
MRSSLYRYHIQIPETPSVHARLRTDLRVIAGNISRAAATGGRIVMRMARVRMVRAMRVNGTFSGRWLKGKIPNASAARGVPEKQRKNHKKVVLERRVTLIMKIRERTLREGAREQHAHTHPPPRYPSPRARPGTRYRILLAR